MVVDNRPGAGGMIGIDAAAKATDGHTIAIGFNGPLAYAPFLCAKTPYDPAKDLRHIVMTTSQANVLAVNAEKVPAKTLAEIGAQGVHVPFNGSPPAALAVSTPSKPEGLGALPSMAEGGYPKV
ncbi:MAG: hypothetical protein Fur0014_17550 [Rubrivivax sp.]